MSLELIQRVGMGQTQELSAIEKDSIFAATDCWETHPHQTLSFPLSALLASFNVTPADIQRKLGKSLPEQTGGVNAQVELEFVVVSPEEMARLDQDEKYGVLSGGCIFISSAVPEEYLAMVVANLGFLGKISEQNNPLKNIIDASTIGVDERRHWTANILDITLAEKFFSEDPGAFQRYLAWRKKIERTDFFRNPEIDDIVKKKIERRVFNRTTHPTQRSLAAKRSWVLGGMLESFGSQMVDQNARMLGISKADILVRRFAQAEEFDPNLMITLCRYLMNPSNGVKKTERARRVRVVDLNAIDGNLNELSAQAHLLTQPIAGDLALLDSDPGRNPNLYRVRPQAIRSFEPLTDRIAYFTRAGLLKSGLTKATLEFLKAAAAQLPDSKATTPTPLVLGEGKENDILTKKTRAIEAEMAKIQAALDQFIQLRIRFHDSNLIDCVPGELERNYFALLRRLEELETQLKGLESALSSLATVKAVLTEQRALLSAISVE